MNLYSHPDKSFRAIGMGEFVKALPAIY